MGNFKEAYEPTKQYEGGYSNLSSDRGGETYKGISRKFFPQNEIWETVDEVKKSFSNPKDIDRELSKIKKVDSIIELFYEVEFFKAISLDKISSQTVCNEIFDTAVNQGKITAAKYFQEALNLLNRNATVYDEILVDGKVGPRTIQTFESFKHFYSKYGVSFPSKIMIKALNGLQFERYKQIVVNNPSQEINFAGWLKRV